MLVESFYQFIGQFIITIAIILAILIIIVLSLGYILIKKNILVLPKITIFLIDILYSPLKKI